MAGGSRGELEYMHFVLAADSLAQRPSVFARCVCNVINTYSVCFGFNFLARAEVAARAQQVQ